MQLLVRKALPHVQVPDRNRPIIMTDRSEAVQSVANLLLAPDTAQTRHIAVAFYRLLLIRQGNVVHLRIFTRVHLTDRLLAPYVEQEDLLVGADTDGERAIRCHLDCMYVATVARKVRYVLPGLAVPHLDIFVDLSSREKH